ncbi:MAG: NAD-dependent epimerase/dehydratase family protein [Muribaculaceae bacterium]|nr:NAD-dependent epimerase/dehydratase family protein [Muribaculaceae bacterium]
MKVFLTGAAGFIGSRVAEFLAESHIEVLGIDNLNSYYDPALKIDRLVRCGFNRADMNEVFASDRDYAESSLCAVRDVRILRSQRFPEITFSRLDIRDRETERLAVEFQPDVILHLAAQPGVRYSITHPEECLDSNVMGFMRILEICRACGAKRLLYASSSSVYGEQSPHAFRESDANGAPKSVYAISKRTNEMLANVYSDLYGFKMTGLRFFSVYGEWGRPDMAPYIFTDALLNDREITLYNGGQLSRDFTYIDDVAEAVRRIIIKGGNIFNTSPQHDVINIGHGYPTLITDFVALLEELTGKEANTILLPMQHGEVHSTLADSSKLHIQFGYKPTTSLEYGLRRFINWYKDYKSIARPGVRPGVKDINSKNKFA